jgi:hypothetical protein
MTPFEVLYGQRCHTPLNWIEPGQKMIFGLGLVEEAETTLSRIQDNLTAVKSYPESYANKRHRPLEFTVGDHVYLKVSPMKGMKRFEMKGKLVPRCIGPFPVLRKCGNMANKLELPPSLVGVHDIFHVSQLKKCLKAPMDVVLPDVAPLEVDLTYPEHPIKILDQKDRVMWRKTIKFFKVQWSNHTEEVVTWKSKEFLRSRHCCLLHCNTPTRIFLLRSNLGMRFLLGGTVVTPLVFTIAINVQSTTLHLVITLDLWKWDLV